MTPEREKVLRELAEHESGRQNPDRACSGAAMRELFAEIDSLRARNIQLSSRISDRNLTIVNLRERLCNIDSAVRKNVGGAW